MLRMGKDASADEEGVGILVAVDALARTVVERVGGKVARDRLLTGHHLLGNWDSLLESTSVAPRIGVVLFVLADFCEAEAFAEDHFLRQEGISAAKERLLERVFIGIVAFKGEGDLTLLVVDAFGVLEVEEVGERLLGPRTRRARGHSSTVLAARRTHTPPTRLPSLSLTSLARTVAAEGQFVGQRVEHFGYFWEKEEGSWERRELELVEVVGGGSLGAVVVHDGVVDGGVHLLYGLHIVLDVAADGRQLLSLLLHRLARQPQLALGRRPLVQDGVVTQVLLHLQHLLHLLEERPDLFQQRREPRLRPAQHLLALRVALTQLLQVPGKLPQEALDLLLARRGH